MNIEDIICNPRNYRRGRTEPVRYLVIHYTGNRGDTAENNARYYASTFLETSAHYFVDESCIVRSVPEKDTAWHCGRADGRYRHPGCRNANSIGIEICMWDRQGGIRQRAIDRAAGLAREIMERYGMGTTQVLRHYDVTGKCCPAPFVSSPEAWAEFQSKLGGSTMDEERIQAIVREAVERALEERERALAEAEHRISPWAAGSWRKAVERGIYDGTRPGGVLTREMDAVVKDRLGLLDL